MSKIALLFYGQGAQRVGMGTRLGSVWKVLENLAGHQTRSA